MTRSVGGRENRYCVWPSLELFKGRFLAVFIPKLKKDLLTGKAQFWPLKVVFCVNFNFKKLGKS